MYSIQIKPVDRVFLVSISGMISKAEGEKMNEEVTAKMKNITPSEYFVVIDTQELKASGQNSLEQMRKGIDIFANGAFKGAYNIIPKSIITNSQASRVGKDVGFDKIVQVQSYEEVLKAIYTKVNITKANKFF